MRSGNRAAALCVFACALSFGQAPAAAPAFEVASVKVSEPGRTGEANRKGNLYAEPGRLTLRNLSLKACVSWAYSVKDYQVSGPNWIDSERYDIVGKAAAPVKDDDLRRMLQALLADRFQLVFHRETRELPVYVLGIAKEGLKMKPSVGEGESTFKPAKGMNKFTMVGEHTSMAQLADLLSQPLQQPVIDQTGVAGGFDFTLDIAKFLVMDNPASHEGEGMTRPVGISAVETALFMALREQLGLKLESKRNPIDMIVVDKAEKVPTEN